MASNDGTPFIPTNAWDYNANHPGLVWYCPCGYTGKYSSVAAHRKGFKLRPACKGRMYTFKPEHVETVTVDDPGESPPDTPPSSIDIPDDLVDPQDIAAFMLGKQQGDSDGPRRYWQGADTETSGDNLAASDESESGGSVGDNIGEGDWSLKPAPESQDIVQDKLTVILPIGTWQYYEWMKGTGWHQGDGGFSAFVADIMYDYFRYVLKVAPAMVGLEDISA